MVFYNCFKGCLNGELFIYYGLKFLEFIYVYVYYKVVVYLSFYLKCILIIKYIWIMCRIILLVIVIGFFMCGNCIFDK